MTAFHRRPLCHISTTRSVIVAEMRQRCRRLNAANLETCCDDVVILTCVMETPSSVCVLSRQDDASEKIMDDSLFIQSATANEVGMLNGAVDTPSCVCVPNGPKQQKRLWRVFLSVRVP